MQRLYDWWKRNARSERNYSEDRIACAVTKDNKTKCFKVEKPYPSKWTAVLPWIGVAALLLVAALLYSWQYTAMY